MSNLLEGSDTIMNYEKIKSLKTFSDKKRVELNTENVPTLLINLYPSYPESLDLYKIPFFRLRQSNFKYYSIDLMYKERIGIHQIRERNQTFIKEFKSIIRDINNYFRPVNPLALKNVIKNKENFVYDLSHWLNLFFTNRRITTRETICKSFFNFLIDRVSDIGASSEYKTIVHIPVDAWAKRNNGVFGIAKKLLNDPVSIILCAAYKYPELFDIIKNNNITFILTDSEEKQLLILRPEDFEKRGIFKLLKIQLFRFRRFKEKWSPEIDAEDEVGSNSTPSDIEVSREDKKDQIAKVLSRKLTKGFTNPDDEPEDLKLGSDFDDPLNDDEDDKELTEKELEEKMEEEISKLLDEEIIQDEELTDEIDNIPQETPDSDILDLISDAKMNKIRSNVSNAPKVPEETKGTSYRRERDKKTLKRIEELTKLQEQVLPNIPDTVQDKILDEVQYSDDVINTTNKNIKKSKFTTFDKKYLDKKFTKDIDNAIKHLNDADIKVFVINKEVDDTSTPKDIKETYTYHLQDENGKKHIIKFDVPKIIDNQYIYLGGNKKQFQRQLILKPLVKIVPDVVHITTFYNKALVSRVNKNLNQKTAGLKKILLVDKSNKYNIKIGNGFIRNKNKFDTPLDFDSFATNIHSMKLGDNVIYFDLGELKEKMKELNIPFSNKHTSFTYGYNQKTKEPLVINLDNENITDELMSMIPPEDIKKLDKIKVGGKFMYSQVKIMGTVVPVILFLMFCEGFDAIVKKAKIKTEFLSIEDENTKERIKEVSSSKQGIIKLQDGYIIWDKYPIENSMLLNGVQSLPLEDITYAQLNDMDTLAELVSIIFNMKGAWAVMNQFKDFMIDPVSKEVLADFGLPTDLTSLLLLANKMLCNNNFTNENDLSNYRMRNMEMIDQYVYKVVSDSYLSFRKTQNNKRPLSLSIKRDAVIKKILAERTVEGVSILNPILDVEKGRAITAKGPSGLNEPRSYTFAKRAYDKSMLGSIGITTSPDANVGMVRQMTLEPKITSTRGYIEVTDMKDIDNLSSANLFTPAELLSPPGVTNDDPTRTSMAYKQTKQMIPVADASPVIIGNGVEKLLPHITSNDFSFAAKKDGKIIEKTNHYIIVEYKDGTHDSIDVSKKVMKNGADGFWIESQMECDKPVGYNFKAKEVLAIDPRFYTYNPDDLSASLNIGVLTKVAIFAGEDQYEDSSPITTKLANRMAADIVMEKHVFIGKNAYVEQIVDVGDKVKTGDPLISFDESFDDPLANKLIDEFRNKGIDEEFEEMSMKHVKSKYTGEIVDIKIQSTVPLDELSESLAGIVGAYYKKIGKDNAVLNRYSNKGDLDYYKCGQIIDSSDKPVETQYGKLEGTEVGDGMVLIKFYIKYKNICKKGDKMTNYTALKGIISNIIPEGYEAFALRRPNEEIGTCIAPGAILARKTPSVLLAMFGNKCMIELTEQIRDFYLNN